MEHLPGVLLYEIAKFCEVSDILLIEIFSRAIRTKLMATKSAFSAMLRKILGAHEVDGRVYFNDFKKLAKK